MNSNASTVIIDGNHLFVRAFEINENKIKRGESDASDLGAVYITLTSIRKRLAQCKFKTAYVTWDRPSFKGTHYRYKLTNGLYKANRKPKADKFYPMLDKCIELVQYMGVKTILPYRLEADDVIAYLAAKSEKPCVIYTGDNDLLQLLVMDGVKIYNIIKESTIDKNNILAYYPVRADQVVKYKAIAGDRGDNIMGIAGYGEKTKSLERLFANYDERIKDLNAEQLEKVDLNRKLVSLGYGLLCEEHKSTEVPYIEKQIAEQKDIKPDYDTFFAKCEEYGFDHITRNKAGWKDIVDQERVANILTEMFKDFGK